jgi:hypothetical protein
VVGFVEEDGRGRRKMAEVKRGRSEKEGAAPIGEAAIGKESMELSSN